MGLVADLSIGGLRLLTQIPLEPGKHYDVDLEVPIAGGRYRVLELKLVCQWSKRNGRLGRYEQGLALTEAAPDLAATVNTLRAVEDRARGLRA